MQITLGKAIVEAEPAGSPARKGVLLEMREMRVWEWVGHEVPSQRAGAKLRTHYRVSSGRDKQRPPSQQQ